MYLMFVSLMFLLVTHFYGHITIYFILVYVSLSYVLLILHFIQYRTVFQILMTSYHMACLVWMRDKVMGFSSGIPIECAGVK